MSEKKWTQGKWSVYEVEGVTHWPGIEAGSTSVVVWGDRNELAGVQAEGLDEARANAHLIAAAPDLYEALHMAVLWLEYDGRYDVQGMLTALAKARGENQ